MRIIFGTTVFLVALALATAAPARQARKRGVAPQSAPTEVNGQVCRPLCNMDMTPCDPPEFKRADGRCNSGGLGITTNGL